MKPITYLAIAYSSILFVAGCIQQPIPGHFEANTNAIDKVTDTARTINNYSAPLNPYAPIIAPIITAIGGLATGISLLIAGMKNGQAKRANSAAQLLARQVVANGGSDTAIIASKMAGNVNEVSTHLAEAIGAANDAKISSGGGK